MNRSCEAVCYHLDDFMYQRGNDALVVWSVCYAGKYRWNVHLDVNTSEIT